MSFSTFGNILSSLYPSFWLVAAFTVTGLATRNRNLKLALCAVVVILALMRASH